MREKSKLKVNIVILNYNGKDMLGECLPWILEAARSASYACGVTVIDNASSDGSVEFLEKNFKEVKIDKRPDNKVLCAFNGLLEKSDEDISILLNSDMKVDPGFVDPLVEVFYKHLDVFLVVPKIMSFDGASCENGKGRTMVKYGMFRFLSRYPGYENDIDKQAIISHSANGAFYRERFVALGGFDDLYLPGIMEDADLCYRAYKKGFKCYYEPKSVIFHKGRESFKKVFKEKKIDALATRNTYLFIWKNIRSARFMAAHLFFMQPWIMYWLFTGKFELICAFFGAVARLPKALIRRQRQSREHILRDDEEVLEIITNN